MRNPIASTLFVFLGGFAVMVLEIVGARFLYKGFGAAFEVWVGQIGVILGALALGYAVGGALADRLQRTGYLAFLLVPTGVFTFLIPQFADRLIDAIVLRHPAGDIPRIWQKLDPMMGSCLIFLLPCFVLAMISPYMVRVVARKVTHVGRISGLMYASSTVGSIAGVFISGYIMLDHMKISTIFKSMGGLTVALGAAALVMDGWFRRGGVDE